MKTKNYLLFLSLIIVCTLSSYGKTVVLQNGLNDYTGSEDAKLIFDMEYFTPAKESDVLAIGNFTC